MWRQISQELGTSAIEDFHTLRIPAMHEANFVNKHQNLRGDFIYNLSIDGKSEKTPLRIVKDGLVIKISSKL